MSKVQNESKFESQKRDLRKRFRFERKERSLGGDWLHLLDADEMRSASTIASYISYGEEPETVKINDSILRSGKRLLLPRTDPQGLITWIEWTLESKLEEPRKLGRTQKVLQPIGDPFPGAIDVVICPALRVDRSGVRLGQGGGSYDRALNEVNAIEAWKVALLHDEEISSEPLPVEPHDIRVNAVALPEILVRFKKT